MSIFHPWKIQRSPLPSLRANANEAQRCGHLLANTPTLPLVLRKATRSSPNKRNGFGAPSAIRLAERTAGVQTSRSISPIGVPAPTWVILSLSALESIFSPYLTNALSHTVLQYA